jgi:hypothetical protein
VRVFRSITGEETIIWYGLIKNVPSNVSANLIREIRNFYWEDSVANQLTSYSEAIEYLYSANQFCLSTDPDEIATLKHLSWYFLPQRMIQIRDMRVHWPLDSYHFFLSPEHGPLSLDTWAPSWEALSRLTGLRRLHINVAGRHVDGTPQELWQEQGANFIKMARTITAPREFVIILPDRECETDYDVGDSRCVLRLPEDTRPTTDDSLL